MVGAGGEHGLLGRFSRHWHPLVPAGRPPTRLGPHPRKTLGAAPIELTADLHLVTSYFKWAEGGPEAGLTSAEPK